MRRTAQLALMALSMAIMGLAGADTTVYRTVDEDGNVVFSDQPSKGAKRITLQPNTSTYAPPPKPVFQLNPPAEPKIEPEAAEVVRYERIRIVSPAAEETVRDNEGKVSVAVALKPKLADGHSLRLILDGKPAVTLDKPIGTLTEIDRGEHRVLAEVADAGGRVVARSDPVLFYMRRHSILHPSAVNALPAGD
jgi:hypothetical protein